MALRLPVVLILALLVVPLAASQQASAPPTLIKQYATGLYLRLDGARGILNETDGAGPTACAALQAPNTSGTQTFAIDVMPFNKTWSLVDDASLVVRFKAATGDAPASTGFVASAAILHGSKNLTVARNPLNFTPGASSPSPPMQHEFRFPAGANGTKADSGAAFGLKITLTAGAPAPGVQSPVQNIAVQCNKDSRFDNLKLLRGAPGELDNDGDGLPDASEDTDDDNDGAPDAVEAAIQCQLKNSAYDFSKDPRLRPGEHDADNDGSTDQAECDAGYDPLSQLSVIPPPPQFPWGLVVLALLVLAGGAGLYFFITTFGKTVALAVVSTPNLFIKPGATAKYQVEARSLRKKGDPITYQLVVGRLPEGWDAKLDVDHVILENVGTGKERAGAWLTVESPEHTDPESAIIAVKAIPLNKAGRKDTTKLPARVKTITSINVPPDAKIPVKRGGPVKLKTEKDKAREEAAEAAKAEAPPEPTPVKGKKAKVPKTTAAEPTPPKPAATKPQLQIGGLEHDPPAFHQGESVKSNVTVTNQGAESQTIRLSLFVNEALADAQTVTVKPGKQKDIKFKWTAQERNKLNIRGELVPG